MVKNIIKTLILGCFLSISLVCYGDENDIFSGQGKTDTLIILDLSASMNTDPSGNSCHTPGCSKREIAREAIRRILDDNGDGIIDTRDEDRLKVRVGYMRFYNCASYNDTGCILRRNDIGSSYSAIYNSVSSDTQFARGGTPLTSALNEAKLYLDYHKATDPYRNCCQKFAVLITDGQDTYSCNGDELENQFDQYKRRKATVAKAKALADAGYKVFAVGFGAGMPAVLKNTLNWAAYFGGTDNPAEGNVGNTSGITPSVNPCEDPNTNDPGMAPLSGYAFLAANASELSNALKQAFAIISEGRYSFSVASVPATRALNENYIYEPSFFPRSNDPFWRGLLKRYSINTDGSLSTPEDWEAGILLQSRSADSRNIYTYKSGAMRSFNTTNITPEDLGQGSDKTTERDSIVGYIRGEATYNPDSWKLGDIFHSNPVTIGKPSSYYNDPRSASAFDAFRQNNLNRERIVLLGANDGQFHAFRASDGEEKWSFIPPNLLPKLGLIAHSSHPTILPHQYFVDGPLTASDVWLGIGDGTNKSASDWRTLLIFGLGRGVRGPGNGTDYLWSKSSSCDTQFNDKYDSAFQYYCGYYALDVTDTASSPIFKWSLKSDDAQTAYLGEPWSKMVMGKVKINGNEKWVGFMGGGYSSSGDQGKGFFVIDLSNGSVIWSYTKASNIDMNYSVAASPTTVDTDRDGFIDTVYVGDLGGNMWRFRFCTAQDKDSCNTANWVGGRLLQQIAGFQRPIFTTATVAMDKALQLWVFWGTGNKLNSTSKSDQDRFSGVIDRDLASTYTAGNLQDITAGTYTGERQGWYMNFAATGEKALADPSVFGGILFFTTYIPASDSSLCGGAGTGRLYAMAIMPVVINGITYNTGAGVLSEPADKKSTGGGDRSLSLGSGIATAPLISQRPVGGSSPSPDSTDLFITVSGGSGQNTTLQSEAQLPSSPLKELLKKTVPSTQILHWKDRRVQPY